MHWGMHLVSRLGPTKVMSLGSYTWADEGDVLGALGQKTVKNSGSAWGVNWDGQRGRAGSRTGLALGIEVGNELGDGVELGKELGGH